MKIVNKISLSFLITAFVLTSIAVPILYLTSKNKLEELILNQLLMVAESRSSHIVTYLESNREAIVQLSKSVVIKRLLLTSQSNKDYKQRFNDVMGRLKKTSQVGKYVFGICVIDTNGIIIASSVSEETGKDKSKEKFFLSAKKGEDSFIKDVYICALGKQKSLGFSAPIKDKDNRLLGVVYMRFLMTAIGDITVNRTGMGKTGEIYLVNKYGLIITPLRFKKNTFLKERVDTINFKKYLTHKTKRHMTEEKRISVFTNYSGIRVLGTHEYIPGVQWCLLAEINEKEALAPLAKIKILFFILMIIIPATGYLIGFFISRAITRSIHRLREGIEIIGRGNLDYKVGTDAKDEVGQLSRTFDEMTRELKQTTVSRNYVDNIIGSMVDALVVTTPEGKIKTANGAACELLGYKQEELIGQNVNLMFVEKELPFKGVKLEKLIKDGYLTNYEIKCKTKDGRKIFVLFSGAVMRDKDENIISIVCVAKDITEHKKMENKLKETSELLQSIMDSSTEEVIVATDSAGLILSWNEGARRLLGYEAIEVVGKKNVRIFHTEEYTKSGRIEPNIKSMIATGKSLIEEVVYVAKSGRTFFVQQAVTPRFDEKGEFAGMLGLARDVTARKQAEKELKIAYQKLKETQQQLIQSSKMAAMGQLAAGISHELNQPLTGIKGFAQAMLMNLKGGSPLEADLNKVVEQADRMDRIIKNVRFFAKKSESKMEEIDINKPIEGSLSLLTQQLKAHNIQLNVSLARNLPGIKGDANQLAQVFLNLITNARDAIDDLKSNKGGKISVKSALCKDKKNLEVIIEDTGSGISKENIEHVFNPFFTTKSPGGGMGLGLSIAYRIIEAHQGKIEVSSLERKWTKFKIILPAHKGVKRDE